MDKRKVFSLSVVAILLISVFALTAAAQDIIYISEPNLDETPRILPRLEAPVQRDFVRNPALLTLDCPYKFFSDLNYHGGTYEVSTSGVWGPDGLGWSAGGYSNSSYYLHALGGDAGFAMKLSDSTNLAALITYRWGFLVGDTDFENYHSYYGRLYGSWEERLNTHTVGLSVLFSHVFSDAVAFGAGLTYSYDDQRFTREGSGDGIIGGTGLETLSIDREIGISRHRLASVVGVLLSPSDRVKIDASVEAGFDFGSAGVKSDLADVRPVVGDLIALPTYYYSDDTRGDDLAGWDIAARIRPTITVSDKMSIPIALDFTYRGLRWSADGASSGYFGPGIYGGIFQGPGTINYKNDAWSWDVTAGVGLTYDAAWATLAGMLYYTHSDFRNGYDMENAVSGSVAGGMTAYTQRDTETKDVISLGLEVEKRFSPAVSMALGLRYDLGWGERGYYVGYRSRYDVNPGGAEVIIDAGGRNTYQDLTLTTGLTLTPIERLTVALGGMVKIPLDPLEYHMNTTSDGWTNPPVYTPRWPYDSHYGRDYEVSGWEYGGMLTVSYEFGCPEAVPAVTPAPVIEPKLEPMSSR